jgi:hypothetical protein
LDESEKEDFNGSFAEIVVGGEMGNHVKDFRETCVGILVVGVGF